MNKKALSESDICDKFIRPAMETAGWNGMDQIYREFPLRAGRVVVRGQKSFRDKTTVVRADCALFHKPNIPLAVVEAKDNRHALGAGMAQAIYYAALLGVPFSDVRLSELRAPDRSFRYTLEGRQWGASFGNSSTRTRTRPEADVGLLLEITR